MGDQNINGCPTLQYNTPSRWQLVIHNRKLYKRKMPQSRQVVPKLFTIVHACIPAPILSPVSTTIFYSILVEIITSAFKVLYKERNNHRAYFKAVVRKGRKATLSVFPFCIIVLHVTLWETNISHVFKISDNNQTTCSLPHPDDHAKEIGHLP